MCQENRSGHANALLPTPQREVWGQVFASLPSCAFPFSTQGALHCLAVHMHVIKPLVRAANESTGPELNTERNQVDAHNWSQSVSQAGPRQGNRTENWQLLSSCHISRSFQNKVGVCGFQRILGALLFIPPKSSLFSGLQN